MASPGMLQSGLSRELLELWCTDKRNGVVIPGYVVEGTLANVRRIFSISLVDSLSISSLTLFSFSMSLSHSSQTILNGQPDEITSMSGQKLPFRLSVDYISFSAHVDFQQNSEFIDLVGAPHLVLVHGNSIEMGKLRAALKDKYAIGEGGAEDALGGDTRMQIYTPRNCETVELYFRGEKMAKVWKWG